MPELSYTQSILKLKCPRCRQGNLFTKPGFFVFNGMSTMPEHCPHCGLKYDQEPGFFWGAMYISYGIAVGMALPVFIIFFALVHLTFRESMLIMAAVMILNVPFIFRISRSIWIHLFVNYKGQI